MGNQLFVCIFFCLAPAPATFSLWATLAASQSHREAFPCSVTRWGNLSDGRDYWLIMGKWIERHPLAYIRKKSSAQYILQRKLQWIDSDWQLGPGMIDAVCVRPFVCIRIQSMLPVQIQQKMRDASRLLLLTAERLHNRIENIFIYRVLIYDALRNCIRNWIASEYPCKHTHTHTRSRGHLYIFNARMRRMVCK